MRGGGEIQWRGVVRKRERREDGERVKEEEGDDYWRERECARERDEEKKKRKRERR